MTGHNHLSAVSGVLRELSQEIESLGAVLCGNPDLAGQHARELQAIDLIAQMQDALASLLTADCLTCAVDEVRIDSLRERLKVCLPPGLCGHGPTSH